MALFSKYVREFSVVAGMGICVSLGSNGIGSSSHMDINIQMHNGVVVANAISLTRKITMNRKRTSLLVATGTPVVTDADADVDADADAGGSQDGKDEVEAPVDHPTPTVEATLASGTKRRVKAHGPHIPVEEQVKTPEIDEDWMEEIQVQVFAQMWQNIAATIQDEDQQKALNSVVLKVFGTALVTVSESEELSKKFATERHGHSQAAVFVTKRYALKTLRDILREESQSEEFELGSRREVITKEAVRRLVWVLSMNLLLEEFWKVNPARKTQRHKFSIDDMIGVGGRVGVGSLSDLSDPVIGLTISASELSASWPDFSKASKNVKQRALTLRREEEEKKSPERRVEREREQIEDGAREKIDEREQIEDGAREKIDEREQIEDGAREREQIDERRWSETVEGRWRDRVERLEREERGGLLPSPCARLSLEEKRQVIAREKLFVTRLLQEIGKETITKVFSHGPANQIPGAAGFEEQEAVLEEVIGKASATSWIRENFGMGPQFWKREDPLFWYNGLQDLDLPTVTDRNYFVTMMQTVIQTGRCNDLNEVVGPIIQKALNLLASSTDMVEQYSVGGTSGGGFLRSGGVHNYEIVRRSASSSDETREQRGSGRRTAGGETETETTEVYYDCYRNDHVWLEVQRVYVHPNGEKENIFSLTVDFWPMSQHQLAMQGDLPIVDSPENHFSRRSYSDSYSEKKPSEVRVPSESFLATARATSTRHPEAHLQQQLQLSQQDDVLLRRILQGSLPDFENMRRQGSLFVKKMFGGVLGWFSEMNQTILDRDEDCPTFQMDFDEFVQKYEKTFSTFSTVTPIVNPSDIWELNMVIQNMSRTYGFLFGHILHYQALQATLRASASAVGIGEQEKEEKEFRLYEILQVKVAPWADIYGSFSMFFEMDKDPQYHLPDSKKCAEQREQIKCRKGNLENPFMASWIRPDDWEIKEEEKPVIQALRRANEELTMEKKQKQEQQTVPVSPSASPLPSPLPVSYITDLVDVPVGWSSYVDRQLRKCVVPEDLHRQNGITYDWYTGVTPLPVPTHKIRKSNTS